MGEKAVKLTLIGAIAVAVVILFLVLLVESLRSEQVARLNESQSAKA
jgi:hypothetical protein